MAWTLYEATRGETAPLAWTLQIEKAFDKIKVALLNAPLPDVTKPFHLYVDEKKGVAKGVLIQTFGP